MPGIAKPLWDLIDETPNPIIRRKLSKVADEIDSEHERRMFQQARDIRKAGCKYMRSVLNDYERGVKRRKD